MKIESIHKCDGCQQWKLKSEFIEFADNTNTHTKITTINRCFNCKDIKIKPPLR